MSKEAESKNGGFTMDLGTGELSLQHPIWKQPIYQDEKGNKISKEEFNDVRIKKLEEKVSLLEARISELQAESSLKVNKNEVPWSHYEPGDFTRYYGELGDK